MNVAEPQNPQCVQRRNAAQLHSIQSVIAKVHVPGIARHTPNLKLELRDARTELGNGLAPISLGHRLSI